MKPIEPWMRLPLNAGVGNVATGDCVTVTPPGSTKMQKPIVIKARDAHACAEFNETKVPLLLMLTDQGPRFHRECYVQDRKIHWAQTQGTMTFAKIYVEANGARWAVLRRVDDQYLLTDLWDAYTNDDRTHLSMGKGHLLATRDAAIAAAMLL